MLMLTVVAQYTAVDAQIVYLYNVLCHISTIIDVIHFPVCDKNMAL